MQNKLFIKRLMNRLGINQFLHRVAVDLGKPKRVTYRGVNFLCRRSNGYEEQLIDDCYNEDAVITRMIADLKGNEGVFLDIGANIGVFSLVIGKALGLQVLAFEPEPINFMKLKRNVTLNPEVHVEPLNVACGDRDGVVLDFTIPFGKNRGHPFVGKFPNPPLFAWETSVPCMTADSILKQRQISRVSGFKIDVEGFEENVLKGMLGVLAQAGPIGGLVELHPHFREVDCVGIYSLLRKHGFTIVEIDRDGRLHDLEFRPRNDGHAIWVKKGSN